MEITSTFLRSKRNKSGKVWRGVIKYRDPDDPSKVKQMTKTLSGKTKTQASAELAEWRSEVEARAKAPDANLSVAEYSERYVSALVSSGSIEKSTANNYHYTLLHIKRGLGSIPLASLKPSEVQEWETGLLEHGYSASTVGQAHRLLKQVCKHATALGDIPRNPCDLVKPPKRPSINPNSLDTDGRSWMLGMLDSMSDTPLSVGTYIALFTGLRRGEICALTWNDVDLDRSTISVTRSLGMDGSTPYLKTPKTAGSRRTIPMPPKLASVIAEHKTRMHSEWQTFVMGLEQPKTEADFQRLYVIGNVAGEYCNPTKLTKSWATLAKAFGITSPEGKRCTFHDLRHTFASTAVESGADIKSVSSILGHANAAMTLNIYSSAHAEGMRRTASIVNDAMEPKQGDVIPFRTGTDN